MFRSLSLHSLILILALALAACGGSATPQLIGSYPRGSESGVVTSSGNAPANTLVVYNAYLELEVYNTDSAADRAEQVAYEHGGYLVSSQSWYQGNEKYATLTLAVPVAYFDLAREDLLRLGKATHESTSGELVGTGDGSNGWNTYSNITVQLRPTPVLGRAGEAASQWINNAVSFIFGLTTALFWIAVFLTPPFLMIVGFFATLRWLVARFRRP
ncbi:MAG: DUF4349 domain-containing protein [Chloroflexi bacterium]|nr:DUF4349 domain-containing protein [Chloroflexota bacterium]